MNKLAEIIKNYHPAEDATTHKFITLSLQSCSRTDSECIEILERFKGEKDFLELIFKENLSFCENSIDKDFKTVGVLFDEWTIGGQLLPYVIRFKQESDYRSFVFISATILYFLIRYHILLHAFLFLWHETGLVFSLLLYLK